MEVSQHNLDVSTPEKLASFMSLATSSEDWNARCDMVKKACGGYPAYWYQTCIASGLLDRTLGAGSSNIGISVIRLEKPNSSEDIEPIGPTGIKRGKLLRRLLNEKSVDE